MVVLVNFVVDSHMTVSLDENEPKKNITLFFDTQKLFSGKNALFGFNFEG